MSPAAAAAAAAAAEALVDNGGSSDNNASNVWVGGLGVLVASLFWGSCFIVCKNYHNMPKDGVHFAFLMSIGILLVGFGTLLSSSVVEDGDFEVVLSPEGLLGGALWACGNFLTVPIIEHVGLGVGLALWAGTNMCVAFVVGATGLESVGVNLPKEPLERPISGSLGVVCAIAALVLFAAVKPDPGTNLSERMAASPTNEEEERDSPTEPEPDEEQQQQQQYLYSPETEVPDAEHSEPLLRHFEVSNNSSSRASSYRDYHSLRSHDDEDDNNDDYPDGNNSQGNDHHKSIPKGLCMAIIAGTLYGFQFVPLAMWNAKVTHNGHIFDHPLPSDTIRSLRFFFSQFCGIFLTAFLGFVVYCLCTRNRPKLVPAKATLPSILCGAVWAIGCAGAMLATSGLGNAVGFPLLLNGAFLVNSAWSILVFGEIQGKKNLELFGAAFVLNVISSVLISIAKG